jgi:hypothetical protein
MTCVRSAIVALVLLVASACGTQEGPCFAPGEPCGSGMCNQVSYCDEVRCLIKKADGEPCAASKECTGNSCEAGKCTGGSVVCTE